jgi:zinc transport system substrate-binding protein
MNCRLVPVFSLLLAIASATAAIAAPRVAASIKPVHSLVAAVMAGIGTPVLILDGATSPHTASLRPSQAKSIESAELIFWIGADLELFLARPIETLGGGSTAIALIDAPGVTKLENRHGGAFTDHHDGEADDHDHGTGYDPHIWLDPGNAIAMTHAIRDALSAADPENASRYDRNAAAIARRLTELSAALKERLAPLSTRKFVVFHDAFQYFEARFGLTSAGILTLNPEFAPGARRLHEIRDRIAETGAVCIFSEPQFEPRIVSVLAAESNARWAELDPLGSDLPPGPDFYFNLLEALAESFERCLGGAT